MHDETVRRYFGGGKRRSVTFNVPITRYFGRAGTTTMHFSNYIVLGLLIASMALAAAMVLSREKSH
jgi:hypothetical protein